MQRSIIVIGITISLVAWSALACAAPTEARGGFGGGGRGGGGFREGGGEGFREGGGGNRDFGQRDFGDRGGIDGGMRSDAFHDFDRGFDHPFDRDSGGFGRIDDGGLGNMNRPDAFTGSRDFAGSGAAMGSGVHNYGSVQHSLASDGGFNNVMRSNAAGVGRGNQTWRATPAGMATQARSVRGNFNNWNAFHGDWYHNHPYAWHRGWWNDNWPWGWSSWGEWAPYWGVGLGALPVYYDYGDNITYDNSGYVDYGGSQVCTAADYYQQAVDLSNAGGQGDFGESAAPAEMPQPPAPVGSPGVSKEGLAKLNSTKDGEWKPFGVYSLVQGSQTNSSTLFQLCSNKKGQIRGNYYNALTDEVEPLHGSIDKKRMRVAWTVGKDAKVVYDTGVANLLKDQSPILVHFGKDSTQQWTLIRLKNPNNDALKNKA